MPEAGRGGDIDQASGLRRLFRARPPQVIAFVAGQETCGRTPLVVQTASALAQAGHRVVVIDENAGPGSALAAFGVARRHDLLDLLRGQCRADQVLQAALPGLQVAVASRLADAPADPAMANALADGMREIERGTGFVLIDSATRPGGRLSALAQAARHVAVVVAAQGLAITHAYALVKRLAREQGRDAFQVVVTRSRTPGEAQSVFENLRTTARSHLGVRLDFLAASRIPAADHLADALLSRLPLPVAAEAVGADDDGLAEGSWNGAAHGRAAVESVV